MKVKQKCLITWHRWTMKSGLKTTWENYENETNIYIFWFTVTCMTYTKYFNNENSWCSNTHNSGTTNPSTTYIMQVNCCANPFWNTLTSPLSFPSLQTHFHHCGEGWRKTGIFTMFVQYKTTVIRILEQFLFRTDF